MLLCFEKWRYSYVNDFLLIQLSSHETVTPGLLDRPNARCIHGFVQVNYYL